MGEIFEEYSEKNRADLPPLTIIQGGGTVYRDESNRNLQFDKNSLSNYKAVNPDDFIIHLRSFEGGLEKATCCGLISPAYHTFHGDGIDSDFYYLYFRSKRFIDTDLKPHVYGIRDGRSIDIDGMKTIPIPWTTVNEQRAIGGFYNSLDSFITLHQRKCQYRSLYGYLSWEQRKLGGLFFESNERSSSMEILSVSVAKGIYPASESNRDTNPGASLANYKVVHKGDVVYNSMRMWQGAVGSSDYDGIVSPAYVVARPVIELDSTCFGYLLKRPEMLYKYLCDSQGNSKDTQTLKYNRFADIEVTMPVNLEEQRVISACLGRVDTLITLHQ